MTRGKGGRVNKNTYLQGWWPSGWRWQTANLLDNSHVGSNPTHSYMKKFGLTMNVLCMTIISLVIMASECYDNMGGISDHFFFTMGAELTVLYLFFTVLGFLRAKRYINIWLVPCFPLSIYWGCVTKLIFLTNIPIATIFIIGGYEMGFFIGKINIF